MAALRTRTRRAHRQHRSRCLTRPPDRRPRTRRKLGSFVTVSFSKKIYDADGNLTGGSPGAHSVNDANQLSDVGFAYDADGNLTHSPALGSLSYNGADQTTTIAGTSFAYAGTGQAQRTQAGSSSLTQGVPGLLARSTTQGRQDFLRDPNGTLIGEHSTGGPQNYYVTDGHGSTIALVGSGGHVTARYAYTPYGKTTASSGSAAAANPFRFAGGYQQATGLYHFGARYYDPNLGRWTQQDSITRLADPTNGNRYGYAGDDPVNNVDPSGQNAISDFFAKTAPSAFSSASSFLGCALSHGAEFLPEGLGEIGVGGAVVGAGAAAGSAGLAVLGVVSGGVVVVGGAAVAGREYTKSPKSANPSPAGSVVLAGCSNCRRNAYSRLDFHRPWGTHFACDSHLGGGYLRRCDRVYFRVRSQYTAASRKG